MLYANASASESTMKNCGVDSEAVRQPAKRLVNDNSIGIDVKKEV